MKTIKRKTRKNDLHYFGQPKSRGEGGGARLVDNCRAMRGIGFLLLVGVLFGGALCVKLSTSGKGGWSGGLAHYHQLL